MGSAAFDIVQSFSSNRFFWRMVWLTLGVKLALAWLLPFTGDEAYFVVWGNNLDYGYYDHPGMTGWWIWVTLLIDQSPLIIRLPAIVGPILIALLMRGFLRRVDQKTANLAAVLFLLSPLNVLNVLMTTDTPIFILSLISGWFVWRAERGASKVNYLLAGLFLGAAFFSKYFAVLLGLSYAVYFLFRRRPNIAGLGLVFLGVIPWATLNIVWLYHHCWTNIVFNIYNRNENTGFSLDGVGLLAASIVLLLGPGIVFFLLRRRSKADRRPWPEVWTRLRRRKLDLFAICFVLPQLVFLLVSLSNTVGLHWLLSFYPFAFPVLAVVFGTAGLVRLVKWTGIYTFTLTLLIFTLLLVPRHWASFHDSYDSVAMGTRPDRVLEEMMDQAPGAFLATSSYAKSALLEFHAREHVLVVGPSYHHARQDDMVTDFRLLEGQSIAIVTADLEEELFTFEPWFDEHRVELIEIEGAKFGIFIGEGFRYNDYRELVLRPVAENYYTLPDWLKRFSGSCYFCEKYDLCEE